MPRYVTVVTGLWLGLAVAWGGGSSPSAAQTATATGTSTRPATTATSTAAATAEPDIRTREDLLQVIKSLAEPETKLAAMTRLVTFADHQLYQGGSIIMGTDDPERDQLQRDAAKAVYEYVDLPIVLKFLDSTDEKLQFFGIWEFGSERVPQEQWMPHLAKLERLIDTDRGWKVIERLEKFPEAKEFLTARLEVETSPYNLQDLGRFLQKPAGWFGQRLERLLGHADAKVRLAAVRLIAGNHSSAPMYQLDFDAPVLDRVAALTQSADAEEPRMALLAFRQLTGEDYTAYPGRCPAWWKEHRAGWENGTLPRWSSPDGLRLRIEKVLIDDSPYWPFSIAVHFQNAGKKPVQIDVGRAGDAGFTIYDARGERIQQSLKMDQAAKRSDWRELGAGDEVIIPVELAKVPLPPGRYMLGGELFCPPPSDQSGLPAGWIPFQGPVRLPSLPFEAPATPATRPATRPAAPTTVPGKP
jgi:hypothetical protein